VPEGLEAEIWRRAADVVVGRTVTNLWFDNRVGPTDLADALLGRRIEVVRRMGKVVLVDTDGPTLGLHFGMTGRLVVDGVAPIERLAYSSGADREQWDRLRIHTGRSSVPALRMNDPRRLGRLSLDPDLSHLGPDVLAVTADEIERAVQGRSIAVKSLLLDQSALAGLGNLCADEVLFWAAIAPVRPACEITPIECSAIADASRGRLDIMLEAGGSTTGVLGPEVRTGFHRCPLDGAPLARAKIGGRTTIWCEAHQR
jgi:formamidopyrimidine-DNA glycosylase